MRNILVLIVLVGVVGYFGSKMYLHGEVSDGMDMAVTMMSPYAAIEYDGVSSTLSGELTVEGIRVQVRGFSDSFYIDRIGIDTPSFLSLLELGDVVSMQDGGFPETFGVLMEGLRIPSSADYFESLSNAMLEDEGVTDADEPAHKCTGKYGFSPDALIGLGYNEQVISMAMTFNNQRGKYSMDMNMSIQDMWDMQADVVFAGDMLSEFSKGTAYRPKLSSMEMSMTDRSLNGRVTEYCGQLGLSQAETIKAQMDSFIYFGTENGIEFGDAILEPYREFIDGKSTFVMTSRPYQPVAFSQIDLYKPSDVPALLNLEASAL
ncbi:MAG: hypothetical protein AAF351_09070 [Pseudomonadota bacterium]